LQKTGGKRNGVAFRKGKIKIKMLRRKTAIRERERKMENL